jgi:hypothetical protein
VGRFGPFYYCKKVDAKLVELVRMTPSLLNKVASQFFATDAPDPLHWTQNKCFGAFRTISLLHDSRCKLAELVPLTHKFAKQRRVGTFRNERTQSTHVLGRFGPFRYCMKVDAKLAELVPLTHKFAKRSSVEIFHNERTRSTTLDPKLMFWCVSDRLVTA